MYKSNFLNLEIDARLVIFSKFYMGEYNILNKKSKCFSLKSIKLKKNFLWNK